MSKKESNIEKGLLRSTDFKGFFHNHVHRSELHPHESSLADDGSHTINELIEAFTRKGCQYFGISPHNILDTETAKRLRNKVDRLNNIESGIHVFLGIENNIEPNGTLRYGQEVLLHLDFIIASRHLWGEKNQNIKTNTDAVVMAIRGSWIDIAGHLSHAVFDEIKRESMKMDFDKVCQEAGKSGVAVEISLVEFDLPNMPQIDNARQSLIKAAIKHNLLVTFDYDLHIIGKSLDIHSLNRQIANFINFGGNPENVINTWPREKVESWFENRKTQRR